MNKTEQMVLGFKPAMKRRHLPPSCMVECTAIVNPMGNFHTLQEIQLGRRGRTLRALFRRWDMHQIARIAGRGLLECMAMAGCVFFAVMATILFGL